MRRYTLIILAIVLFISIVGSTFTYSLVVNAPYIPGDGLFPVQAFSERLWGLGLNGDPSSRADVWLGILAQRIQDMAAVRGTDAEETAVAYFQHAVTESSRAITQLPADFQPAYQARLRQTLAHGLATLESLTLMQGLASTEATNLYIQLRVTLQEDMILPPQQPQQEEKQSPRETSTPDTTFLSTNLLDDLHRVPFPPGADMSVVHSFFPLFSGHSDLLCSDCHSGESYKGAPNTCVACHHEEDPHSGNNGPNCANCHNISYWQDVNFDHTDMGDQLCSDCHTPPENHFPGSCSSCHISVTDWLVLNFDHSVVGNQDCANCHLRPINHYQGACTLCHSDTANWQNAIFNHSTIGNTDCASCHTPPANHFSGACSTCHGDTGNWRNASFNHSVVSGQACSSCHVPPANHYGGECSACHGDTGNWRNASFNHSSVSGQACSSCHVPPGNHFSGSCSNCHVNTGNWHDVNFSHEGFTDCQSCHARPDNHFAGQCSDCHNTSNWDDANFSHTFPINHEGANGNCATCHPGNNYASYTCYNCHDQGDVTEEHQEEGINDFGNCMACHPDGRD